MVRRIRARFRARGYQPIIAVAPTPDAARALARFGRGECLSEAAAETRALPVQALEAGEEVTVALTRAGLQTLAALEACPTAALTARFGAGLVAKLRRVLGLDNARITPLRPLPSCLAERHFPNRCWRSRPFSCWCAGWRGMWCRCWKRAARADAASS